MDVLELGGCVVRVFPETRYLETVFPDAAKVSAAPQTVPSYRATAERLGYGDDVWALCREHEIAHTTLLQALGLEYSPTLWAVAHGAQRAIPGAPGEMEAEEDLVLAYQRWRNVRQARAGGGG
jgi:hypothetical protein